MGRLSTKVLLAIYVNILSNINDATNITANRKNEKIENKTYYLYIPMTISSSCGEGQFYYSAKYLIYLSSI